MSEDATLDEFTDSVEETKDTEQELFGLGKIPVDWSLESLSDSAEIIPGNSPPSSTYNENGEGLPFFQGNSNFGHFHPAVDTWCSEPRKEAHANDILMSIRAPVGDLNIADRHCCIGRGLAAFRPKTVNGLYLFYHLSGRQAWLSRLATGSTFKSVTKGDLQHLDISSPPLSEQRKIATVLYTVDQAIEKTDAIIEQTHSVKRSLMQDVFHGYHSDFQEYQTTPVGEIPTHWSVASIGDVVHTAQYGISESLSEEGQYPIFRMNNIENGYVIDEPLKYIDLDATEFEKYRVEKGDILFNRTNSLELVGKTGIYELEGDHVFASYLVRLQTNERADPYYLNYYMNSFEAQNRMMDFATKGVSQANINANSIQQVQLPLPPIEEQREIANRLSSIDEQIENNKQYKSQLKRFKRGLMQDLLSGTVRTTDTNIEVPDKIAQYG